INHLVRAGQDVLGGGGRSRSLRGQAEVSAKRGNQGGPAVQDNKRSVTVRVERHFVSERRALPLSLEPPQRGGSGVQLAEKGIQECRRAASELLVGNAGVTGDAQGRLRPCGRPGRVPLPAD